MKFFIINSFRTMVYVAYIAVIIAGIGIFYSLLFSLAGLLYCVPQLLFGEESGLLTKGWYPSVCAHSSAYGFGETGFFVCLFIYSKLAELLV